MKITSGAKNRSRTSLECSYFGHNQTFLIDCANGFKIVLFKPFGNHWCFRIRVVLFAPALFPQRFKLRCSHPRSGALCVVIAVLITDTCVVENGL
jgi:hypothetical protein